MDLVNVYSEPGRDPRGHTITIAYTAKGNMDNRKVILDIRNFSIAFEQYENAFQKTMPKSRKRTFKTKRGVLKRIYRRDLIWNDNRKKDFENQQSF